MNFKQATDALLETVTLEDLAMALGVSIQAVRQARAAEGTAAFRPPPPEWQAGVVQLARARQKHFQRLGNKLKL
jgi:hypothetical protein